jgi:hypothetical protein
VRIRVWASALALGALAAVLLGVSMLAASQTTSQAAPPLDLMSPPLVTALMKASDAVPAPTSGTTTLNVPCLGEQRVTSSGSSSSVQVQFELVGGDDYQRSIVRQARCLAHHGFLSRSDLASIIDAKSTHSRHGVGRVVPLSLQLDPSSLALAGWGLLVGLVVAAAALFIHAIRRESRRSGSFSR